MNIKDVAKIAGVSTSTVSLVLNKKSGVSEKTRLRVQSVAEKLNYIPSDVARSLVTRKTKSVGLLVPNIAEIYFGTLARTIQDALNIGGYTLILCNSDNRYDKERDCLDFLIEKNVEGIIMVPRGNGNIDKIMSIRVPVVFIDSYMENVDISYVGVNNEQAGYNATEHLIKFGHRRIACITGPIGFNSSEERILGYKRALEDAGIEFNNLFLKYTDWTVEGGFQATKEIFSLARKPTAVFVTGDTCAIGVFEALYGEGYSIPDDVSVVGFDDMKFSPFLKVPLTTVRQPISQLGNCAVGLLFEKINSENRSESKKIILDTELVIRESCGFNR